MINSRLDLALVNISKVDLGKWKFVIKLSTILNLYPGVINISAQPDPALNMDPF